jgi:hypothetical protein
MHDIDNVANEIIDQLTQDRLSGEFDGPSASYGNDREMELAVDLLGASSDAELDQFFGDVFKKIGRVGADLLRGPAGQMLKGALRSVAKKALPMAGSALGGMFGGPAGGSLGGKLAGALGNAVGLELELSESELEEEVAKRVIRVANDAAVQVAKGAQLGADPKAVVTQALQGALKQHLPGLGGASGTTPDGARAGRWVRRGSQIIIYGV